MIISLVCGADRVPGRPGLSAPPIYAAAAFGIAGLLGVPRWFVNFQRKRRISEVPRRVRQRHRRHRPRRQGRPAAQRLHQDHRQRGGRAGARANSAHLETQALGVPLADAVGQAARARAGPRGELLRHRHRHPGSAPAAICRRRSATCRACCATASKMKGKIGAMSMEAKASACDHRRAAGRRHGPRLPDQPRTTSCCSSPSSSATSSSAPRRVWMTIGVLVMRKMINFDF